LSFRHVQEFLEMPSMADIRTFTDRLAREYNPDRIVLFGSHATGSASPDSDVDLLVVLPFEGRNLDKSVEMLTRMNPSFPIDLLARQPADTARRYRLGDPLIRTALDTGMVLHERAD